MTLAEWNAGAGSAWNRFRTSLARHVDQRLEFWRAVEVQERGALHHHVVVWSPVELDDATVQLYAIAAGYGCVFDLRRPTSFRQLANYVSKYVTKGDDRQRAHWTREVVNRETGEVTEETDASYRTHSQSHGWGATLKGLREIARAQAQARAAHLRMLGIVTTAGEGGAEVAAAGQSPSHSPPGGTM